MAKKPWEPVVSQLIDSTKKSTSKKSTPKKSSKSAGKAASSAAKKSSSKAPKKPALSTPKKLTRAEKREANIKKHWEEREGDLNARAAAKAAEKAAQRAENQRLWREMRSERDLKREAAWSKYKGKKSKGK